MALVSGALVIAVFAVFGPLCRAGFVSFDDNDYIGSADQIQHGLSWAGAVWAFTTVHASMWHPLTWISYQCDSQFYGMNPGGFHFTNILLHAASSVLLFLLLRRLTGSEWRSALVAALFALHPTHVESVAWISERKDVLSTLFWMLTVLAYAGYAQRDPANLQRRWFYLLSILLFALGLMAKPMLVTLPFILLLLDYWPLRRKEGWLRLALEKIPFVLLAIASAVVTLLVARQAGAVKSMASLPWSIRLETIPVAWLDYVIKSFWPTHLAVLYPYRLYWPVWRIALGVCVIVLTTVFVLMRAKRNPWMAVGWFWFLGMLVPVSGLVQVGPFYMADRYTYLSNTGLFIAVVWSLRMRMKTGAWCAGVILAGCIAATFIQAGYWHDSETLFRHTLAVTVDNSIIESDLAQVLVREGRAAEALPHALKVSILNPTLALGHYNLGNALLATGDVAGALSQFEIHARLSPADPVAQYNFGNVLLAHGLAADALAPLQAAARLQPRNPEYQARLGDALRQTGHESDACSQYEKTLVPAPNYLPALSSLAWLRAASAVPGLRNGAEAVELALRADHLAGENDPGIAGVLAAAYAEAGDFSRAVAAAQRGRQLAQSKENKALAAVLDGQLKLYEDRRPFP